MFNVENQDDNPVVKEYSRLAKEYDDRWSFYIDKSIEETLRRIEFKSGQRLLDVGCGTGVLLERISQKHPEVLPAGIDPTQKMLAVARERLKRDVPLKQGWAERLPFEKESFEIVVSCNMFHYIRKPEQALREFRRVLKPDGLLIVTDWCDDYITCKICDWYLRIFNSAHFRTYRKRECRDLLLASDFEAIEVERYKINWMWGMMTASARKVID